MANYDYENKSAIYNEEVFDKIKESIAVKVKELRTEKNITQQELADVFGLSRNHLAQVETGRAAPSLKMLYDIAIYFDCSLDYLIGLSPIRNSKGLSSTNVYEIIDDYDVSFGERYVAEEEKDRIKEFIKDPLNIMVLCTHLK